MDEKRLMKLEEEFADLKIYMTNIGKNTLKLQINLKNEILAAREDLINTAQDIFKNSIFIEKIQKSLRRYLDENMGQFLETKGLYPILRKMIKNYIKTEIRDLVDKVVKEVVSQTNKKLSREYEVMKSLSLSIDSKLKETVQNLPMNYTESGLIKKRIINILCNDQKKNNELKVIN